MKNHQLQEAMAGGGTAGGTGESTKLPYGYGDPYKELWEVWDVALQEACQPLDESLCWLRGLVEGDEPVLMRTKNWRYLVRVARSWLTPLELYVILYTKLSIKIDFELKTVRVCFAGDNLWCR